MRATDVLVIGGGPGGYAAAIRAVQHGADVTLVEREALGGTCLNHGCIPSKALISAGEFVDRAETATAMGIYAEPYVDYEELVAWKDDVVQTLTSGVETLCSAANVTLLDGTVAFRDERSVRVSHMDGDETTVKFEYAIVATGSQPIELPGFEFDGQHMIDSRQALALESVPGRLLVVGAGYIGMELSTAFAKLGSDVTVVEALDSVLPNYDDELSDPIHQRVTDLGIDVNLESAATGWTRRDGQAEVTIETESGDEVLHTADTVLVAVGREPVTEPLHIDRADIATDESGFVETDESMRTANERVFAIGDVAGEPMLAHAAVHEGVVAAGLAAGDRSEAMHPAVPTVVFTDPEIATVGLSPTEADDSEVATTVGRFPFAANGRALTREQRDGFVRLVADESDGTVLGAQIVGPEASELIAECSLAVETGATLQELAATIHPHPTLSESIGEAAEQAFGRAIHTSNR